LADIKVIGIKYMIKKWWKIKIFELLFYYILQKLNEKNIPKSKLFLGISKRLTWRERGNYWYSLFNAFVIPDVARVSVIMTFLKVWIPSLSFLAGISIIIVAGFLNEIIKIKMGRFDYEHGIQEELNAFLTKDKKMNPFNDEVRETLKGVCKRLGITHYFKDIE